MEYAPLMLDAALLLLLLYFAVTRWRQGFAEAMLRLVSAAVSLAVGWYVAPIAAQYAFDNLLLGPILQRMQEALSQAVDPALSQLEQALDTLPEALTALLSAEQFDLSALAQGGAAQNAAEFSERLVELAVMPAAVSLLQALFFLVIFLLLFILLGFLARALRVANHLPLLGGINRFFGLLVGLTEGAVVLFLVALACRLLQQISPEIPFLTEAVVGQTFLFSRLMQLVQGCIALFAA